MTPCPGTCPACLSLYGVVATLFRLRDNWRIGEALRAHQRRMTNGEA